MELKKIKLPFKIKKAVLALGPQKKNRVCFTRGNYAYMSPLHADLNNPGDFFSFEKSVKYFLKKNPKIIACDLHPEYQSTKYGQNLQLTAYSLQLIQHHHAHIASCMVENSLKNQKVIGVAFDGTGLGADNRLWGGEFFICNYKNFKRAAHLKEIPLLGAERAISEPIRLAIIWLYLIYKDRFLNLGLDLLKKIKREKWGVLKKMYLAGFNSPLTSSMGRLFDAAASLVLGKAEAKFEAELAMELEKIAVSCKLSAISYKFKISKDNDTYILDPALMFKEIIADLKNREPREKVAYRFHLTIAQMARKMCLILRKENKINTVVLSGGVFQNNLLLRMVLDLLYKEDFRVFTHNKLSSNDSGISLGQAAIANFRD
ncbi:MAG: hypothetical protein PHC54_04430 [Candidatus Omnitrophica bacterium]|nr:hypothetical protein [Candidatus Omnitrophota bacterium]MDD5592539.1 hypothetical protein [Candidatus Omnitrophota bacterium]